MARFFISSVRLTVDRLPDMQEVGGSNPLLRTKYITYKLRGSPKDSYAGDS